MKLVTFFNGKYARTFLVRGYSYYRRACHYYLDTRIGKDSLEKVIESKHQDQGANETQSTDYRVLKNIFNDYKLTDSDVFVDVGCGQGRVISYLIYKKSKCRFIGIELDKEVMEYTQNRFKDFDNVSIINDNVLTCIPEDATVFYLFNPFNGNVFVAFIEEIEKKIHHKIHIIYSNDLYGSFLTNRKGWSIESQKNIQRKFVRPASVTIFKYEPLKY
ncbi:MAG: methyltransferase domain-containing protein [Eubacteriales bacterium]